MRSEGPLMALGGGPRFTGSGRLSLVASEKGHAKCDWLRYMPQISPRTTKKEPTRSKDHGRLPLERSVAGKIQAQIRDRRGRITLELTRGYLSTADIRDDSVRLTIIESHRVPGRLL